MEQYIMKGGNPLVGDVTISGAKNAALGILAASIMTDEDVVIENLPDVSDITAPRMMDTSEPRARKPFKCWSMGLLPMVHPPGRGTSALLYFPRSAPMK